MAWLKQAADAGLSEFSEEELRLFEERYHELIELGRKENKATKHLYAKSDEQTLLNRLEMHCVILWVTAEL